MMSCKKQINTQATAALNNYLVVVGNITIGDSITITLSHTVNISGNVNSNAELNAAVTIEGSQGGSYSLMATSNGKYVSGPLNLPATQNYRLKIVTADGKQYAPDFVPVKNSPPIDTVNYTIQNSGVQLNVNTHDPANNTHHYRWGYNETYIIHSVYDSHYIAVNQDTTAVRTADRQSYQCWVSDTSSAIVLGSSAKLSKDVIGEQPVTALASNSEKIHIRYSILLKQYALTSDAYNYPTLLKKNTDQLGSIFDAQPSELTGNIHCISNLAEPVIGYVTAVTVSKQRIFIDNKDLPAWTADLPGITCQLDTLVHVFLIPKSKPSQYILYVKEYIYSRAEIPIDAVAGGFAAAFPSCADCTLRGVNKPPVF